MDPVKSTKVIKEVKASIEEYRFNDTANSLYAFVWHEFCDWYLEVIKPNLYGKVDTFDNTATRATLYRTLDRYSQTAPSHHAFCHGRNLSASSRT